jgi:uncharacterized protein YjcR
LIAFTKPRLSEAERNQAIGMLLDEASVVDASRTFNCSHNTVHELVRRYRLMIFDKCGHSNESQTKQMMQDNKYLRLKQSKTAPGNIWTERTNCKT